MTSKEEQIIKIPMLVIVLLFISALIGIVTWSYAENKETDSKIAELKNKTVATDQVLQFLTQEVGELNDNLKAIQQQETQNEISAMLRELLKKDGSDPDKVVDDARKKEEKKKLDER